MGREGISLLLFGKAMSPFTEPGPTFAHICFFHSLLRNGLAQSNCRYDIPSLSPCLPPSFLLVFPVAIVGQVGEGGREGNELGWRDEEGRGGHRERRRRRGVPPRVKNVWKGERTEHNGGDDRYRG